MLAPQPSTAQFFAADKIYEQCVDAVVVVLLPNQAFGTGFFINEQGYLLTNYHVIAGYVQTPWSISIITKAGNTFPVDWIDPIPEQSNLDVAILKINTAAATPYLPLKPQEAVVGEDVVAIGHPNGDWWNQSRGIISKIHLPENPTLLQHDVPTDEGNSGGPLINAKGQVVAIVTAYEWMLTNTGVPKVQETGKKATKISAVIPVLERRGIRYYTHGIVLTGLTEYERQFDQLQREREALNRDREQLRREREQLERERQQLAKEKAAFEQRRLESLALLQRADQIRAELTEREQELQEEFEELARQRQEIADKMRWIRQKEAEIYATLAPKFSLELGVHPNYLYHHNTRASYGQISLSAGLFLRFGFERNSFGKVLHSDRVGVTYSFRKIYNPQSRTLLPAFYHDIAVALEFSDVLRLAIGMNLTNSDLYFSRNSYFFGSVALNFSGYPFAAGTEFTFFTDERLELKNYAAGLFFKIALNFLRV